jgi:ribosome-binding ATPase YchF (GTP1/OBG family)
MKVGLIGQRGAGKTTLFNMLTGLKAQVGGFGAREEVHLGVIKVPDGRVDRLAEIFKPKKTTYAEIRFTDFPPSQGEDDLKSNNALVTQMREVDAIALVLGDFAPLDDRDDSGGFDGRREPPQPIEEGKSPAAGRSSARTVRAGVGK